MKKNIMIITQSLTGGGSERLVSDISKGLEDRYNIYLVVYQKKENEYDYGGFRIDLNIFSNSKIGKVISAIRRFIKIWNLKRKYKIDCSISFVPHTDYVNVITKQKHEKVIIDVVSNMSLAFPSGIKRKFRQYILNKADLLVTVSEGVRRDLIDNFKCGKENSVTIYNTCNIEMINDSKFENEYSKFYKDNESMFITSMGSFRHPKGQWHLIKAFSIVKEKLPNVKLILLGDGIYRDKFNILIEKLGVKDSIIMPGFLEKPHSIIKNSDVFAFSSIYEGFGNVIVEALACGTPVVSCDCQFGPREILSPDTGLENISSNVELCQYGILTPPFPNTPIDISTIKTKEEEQLAEAIVYILRNKEVSLQYSEKGLEYSKSFDYRSISNQWAYNINQII